MAVPVRAVLFDLDGTLVDSETHTDEAIHAVASRHGVAGFWLPHTETRGRTWEHVADAIRARAQIDCATATLAAELLDCWNQLALDLKPVPGAPAAVRAAAERLALGIVSSSPRAVIDRFLEKLGVAECIAGHARIGSEAVTRFKPDPEGYLLGARALGVTPSEALVFEDSYAGLLAARAAGMRAIFVSCCAADIPGNTRLATAALTDYRALPAGFWDELAGGRLDLAGRSFA